MTTAAAPTLTAGALRGRLWRGYLAPRWRAFAVSMVCAVVVAALSAALAAILKPAINDLLQHPRPGAWIRIPLAVAAIGLVRGLAQVGQATLVNRIGNSLVGDIQAQLFGRLVRADLARLRSEHSGSYVASVLYDAGLIQEAATAGAVNMVRESLTVVGAAAVMLWTDPWLGGGLLLGAPVLLAVLRRYSRRTRKATQGAMAETSALSTAVMESLDGIKIVKIENREAYEEARVAAVIRRRQAHLIRNANARATAAPASETVTTIMTAAVLAYAGWRALSGGMDAGSFVAFLGAVGIASQSLRQVANLQTVISQGLAAATRLFAALDVEPQIREAPDAVALPAGEGVVRLEAVSFAYAPDGAEVLDGLTLEARRGEVVALVGPSGAGKSTVLNLIPRFYDVTGGAVTIDGCDVRKATLASLRARIALVTQEPFLFDDTVAANIAYSRPDATTAEIEAAARAAAAHDFILALPGGYGTPVGEAGARLSGGQRQRIAIARAFLKDAPILLLDEATSALDTESEAQVQAALGRLMQGRTTLLIAHRLSTVRGADRIYVLDRGRVAESGTHESLMRAGGLYARLAGSQDLEHETAE
ncbi:MAG TPA: ABC transporter transmembrane domain-containing protein [Caulobacteraceae bacterium]|nr:ABC transporter transmembrane domain-containing protein [Caulobacteraceae bacterium]